MIQHNYGQYSDRQYIDHYNSNINQPPLIPWLNGLNDHAKIPAFSNVPYCPSQDSHPNFCPGVGQTYNCGWDQRITSIRSQDHEKLQGRCDIQHNLQPVSKLQIDNGYNNYLPYTSNYNPSLHHLPCNSSQALSSIPLDHYPPTPFSEDLSPPPSNHSSPRSAQSTPQLDTHHVQDYKTQQEELSLNAFNGSHRTSTDQRANENHVSSFQHDREDMFYEDNSIYGEIPCQELLSTVNSNPVINFCTDQVKHSQL